MANVFTRRLLNRNLFRLKDFTLFYKYAGSSNVLLVKVSHCSYVQFYTNRFEHTPFLNCKKITLRDYSKNSNGGDDEYEKKPSVFQRFKQMYKDYWYVLVPVHLVTSAAWFGGFYYLAKSGVDIAGILESWHMSENIVNSLRDSSMGYVAVTYALYKIATPARYTVTLGGTTISINYLKKWGYIKPVPSKERLKEMYHEQKENLLESLQETKEGLKDKKEHIIDDFDKSIKKIKDISDKVKSKENVGTKPRKKTEK